MKQFLLLFILVLFFLKPAISQEQSVYKTKKGNMLLLFQLKEDAGDSTVVARSQDLFAIFDYNVPRIKFRVSMVSFSSRHSGLDSLLNRIIPEDMYFEGDMGINKISTDNNPQVIFPIEGDLELNGMTKFIKLSGNLFPVQKADNYRAQLTVSTELRLSEFGLKEMFPNFEDRFYIEIYQSVLEPSS